MNRNFTKEDIIKKHQTNVKSAVGLFALTAALGVIYIVRYFITDNFDFYFSLSFTEVILRKLAVDNISAPLGYSLIALFVLAVLAVAIVILKKPGWLHSALGLYMVDFAFLAVYIATDLGSFSSDRVIDIIFHLIITVFLIVGLKSQKELKAKG